MDERRYLEFQGLLHHQQVHYDVVIIVLHIGLVLVIVLVLVLGIRQAEQHVVHQRVQKQRHRQQYH
jgi:type IV secretory pathway component VirB8